MWELSSNWYELIIRAVIVFLGLFLMFKLWGRKHLGEMAAFDFVLLLIMSEAVQNSLVGNDKTVVGGLIVVATFMVLSSIMNIISFNFRKAEHFLEGTPKVIIRDGKIMENVMNKERISLPELLESIREQGVLHLHDIGLAMLEANGKISVIRKEHSKKKIGINAVFN
jgi:uncharacterized membrane protein YcaP (DUF421 family)